jgi:hypothetical protein
MSVIRSGPLAGASYLWAQVLTCICLACASSRCISSSLEAEAAADAAADAAAFLGATPRAGDGLVGVCVYTCGIDRSWIRRVRSINTRLVLAAQPQSDKKRRGPAQIDRPTSSAPKRAPCPKSAILCLDKVFIYVNISHSMSAQSVKSILRRRREGGDAKQPFQPGHWGRMHHGGGEDLGGLAFAASPVLGNAHLALVALVAPRLW